MTVLYSSVLSALYTRITCINVVLALAAYICCRIVYQIVHYRFFHPLSQFPGPFWGSVTRLWVAYHNVKEDERFVEYDLHKKHGMLVLCLCVEVILFHPMYAIGG